MKALLSWYRPVMISGPKTLVQKIFYHTLTPLSLLYGGLMWVRARGYRNGWLRSEAFAVPVISIGNLTVGGTGKTPTVDLVARYYLDRGRRVAVVSRGYGSRGGKAVRIVSDGREILLSAAVAGDEPLLLAQRNPDLIVITAPCRGQGIQAAVEGFGAELIILDDGFQHLRVRRDLDIVLLDAAQPFGNGRVLPAGLLREFPSALQRSRLFLLTRAGEMPTVPPALPGPALVCRHRLAEQAIALNGQVRSLASLRDRQLVAFAGIADPEAFFAALRAKGLALVKTLSFADHTAYRRSDIALIFNAVGAADGLITTEKDAVKLHEKDFPVSCYRVPLELVFDQPEKFYPYLDRFLAKESAMPIKQELLDILACPQCKGEVRLQDDGGALICDACRLAYPIRDDIPVMLIDEAKPVDAA